MEPVNLVDLALALLAANAAGGRCYLEVKDPALVIAAPSDNLSDTDRTLFARAGFEQRTVGHVDEFFVSTVRDYPAARN